jgi:hypothetical protein
MIWRCIHPVVRPNLNKSTLSTMVASPSRELLLTLYASSISYGYEPDQNGVISGIADEPDRLWLTDSALGGRHMWAGDRQLPETKDDDGRVFSGIPTKKLRLADIVQ